ncbi:uncharacterized protein [Onthophagus taurus]|uniref:uncharacterized protein n=1 Tax=Onthophagus taurus TaxID=166361 RepID=UPI0039BDDC5A
MWERVERFKVGEAVESDHQPLEVEVKGVGGRRRAELGSKFIRTDWSEEGVAFYRGNLDTWQQRIQEINGLEELTQVVREATLKRECVRRGDKVGRNDWYDGECKKAKREARRRLRLWRRGKIGVDRYREARREYRELCSGKKTELREKEAAEIRGITREGEVWRYLKKGKKGREMITSEIHMTEWKSYFMGLLGGVETRLTGLGGYEGDGGEEIAEEEMEAVLRRLKKGKAPGEDGIHNEAWLEASRVVRVKLLEGMNIVWRGGGIPEGWKVGVICPVYI